MAPRRIELIRHAHAGERTTGPGDGGRPLSERGRGQAERLAEALRDEPLDRVLSSPLLRCVQTVEPLARSHGLEVEPEDALLEGTDPVDTLLMLEALDAEHVAACTHGDIVPGVLDLLRAGGVELDPAGAWRKGSTWRIEGDGRRFRRATYLPPQ